MTDEKKEPEEADEAETCWACGSPLDAYGNCPDATCDANTEEDLDIDEDEDEYDLDDDVEYDDEEDEETEET